MYVNGDSGGGCGEGFGVVGWVCWGLGGRFWFLGVDGDDFVVVVVD